MEGHNLEYKITTRNENKGQIPESIMPERFNSISTPAGGSIVDPALTSITEPKYYPIVDPALTSITEPVNYPLINFF